MLGVAGVRPAAAVTHLERGMTAPIVQMNDLSGAALDTSALKGRAFVLVFGEVYHEKTLSACEDVQALLAGEKLAGEAITPLLVIAQTAPPAALQARVAEADITWRVLHDVNRRAFGTYRVAVMPSVVVVDGEGRVVHALAGYIGRFKDIVSDALLVSVGKLSTEEFDASLHPGPGTKLTEEEVRASRVTSLARQLARRGLPDLAEEKYIEAIEMAPGYVPARLGLGLLRLDRGRLAEAELEFSAVLAAEPKSIDAKLGLAFVQTMRGGDELDVAEALVREVLAIGPNEPRPHYLMGLIHEHRDGWQEAAASYRTAAELLMSQRGSWASSPKGDGRDERGE